MSAHVPPPHRIIETALWWSELEGRQKVTSRQVFGRDLGAAFPGVTPHKNNITGRFYLGVKLKDDVAAAVSPV